jgi:hypothetical protein
MLVSKTMQRGIPPQPFEALITAARHPSQERGLVDQPTIQWQPIGFTLRDPIGDVFWSWFTHEHLHNYP